MASLIGRFVSSGVVVMYKSFLVDRVESRSFCSVVWAGIRHKQVMVKISWSVPLVCLVENGVMRLSNI